MDELQVRVLLDLEKRNSAYKFLRDLFYTTTRPKHRFKSERMLREFHRLQKTAAFGKSISGSYYKKMLILKTFFQWYFRITRVVLFRKIFRRFFLRRRTTFGGLAMFFHILERNVLVLLVRAHFFPNLDLAFSFIKGHCIFVNGRAVTLPFYATRVGDVVEVMGVGHQFYYYYPLLFLVQDFFLFRLFYFFGLKTAYWYTTQVLAESGFRMRRYFSYRRYLPTFQRF